MSLKLQQTTLTRGFPLIATIQLSSPKLVAVDLGEGRTRLFRFEVKTPSRLVSLTIPARPGLQVLGRVDIDPRKPYEQIVVLPQEDFSEIGWYSVSVTISSQNGQHFEFDGGERSFEVLPYSKSQIANNCSELAHALAVADSADKQIELSYALASINDPAALPYLEDGLGHGWGVDDELLTGIERIGTRDAVEYLGKTLHDSDPALSQSSRAALHRLAERPSSSPEVKSYAQSLLRGEDAAH